MPPLPPHLQPHLRGAALPRRAYRGAAPAIRSPQARRGAHATVVSSRISHTGLDTPALTPCSELQSFRTCPPDASAYGTHAHTSAYTASPTYNTRPTYYDVGRKCHRPALTVPIARTPPALCSARRRLSHVGSCHSNRRASPTALLSPRLALSYRASLRSPHHTTHTLVASHPLIKTPVLPGRGVERRVASTP